MLRDTSDKSQIQVLVHWSNGRRPVGKRKYHVHCFTDEAGKPEPNHPGGVFVLAGVIIRAEQWAELDEKFEALKRKYELNQDDEIHAAWLDADIKEQDDVPGFASLSRLGRLSAIKCIWKQRIKEVAKRKENAKWLKDRRKHLKCYVHLTQAHRHRLLQDCCDLLANCEDVSLLIQAVDTAESADGNGTFMKAFLGFTDNFRRFLREKLESHHGSSSGTGNSAHSEMGLIVHDTCDRPMIAKVIARVLGNAFLKIKGEARAICPAPLFVDSKLTSMIQFADLCAYAVRSYLTKEDARLFDRIEHLFDYANHDCGKRSCDCRICAR